MTKGEQNEFKKLIKDGTIEALSSGDGQKAVINALVSKGGQDAIVGALRSENGQDAIKTGTLEAMKSEEGKDIILDVFVDAFHEVVVPIFEDRDKKIKSLESKVESLGNLRGLS